jgi:UDP-N-acetylglucosamine diphosphorylase / glucose-1-phosphate thymidylyltransferase / UDP-N-acetylgalactosamine diphosphorylase / glucosamine-1-phosphate N-acetyltransferase / galactosamine-1-phosphate N-acetyltransferase
MTNIVIPMAGLGSRFADAGFDKPKPLIEVDGKTLLEHSVESLGIPGRYIFITREYENREYNKQITEILDNVAPGHIEIRVSGKQHGTSYSALFAKDYINTDEELILTNCDQRLEWDPEDFLRFSRSHGLDGSILTHESSSHKHSYAVIKNGFVTHLAEKNPISNNALVGLHYWKSGKDFVSSAEKLVKECISENREAYVSLTYNYLIADNKKIVAYQIPANAYIPLGTPRDLEIYQAKVNEYYQEKPKTIFLDLDGTVLRHAHHFPSYEDSRPELLPGVLNKVNEWITSGHKIVITTARREANRSLVESQLRELGLHWDYMVMDVSKGQRVLINDKLQSNDVDRAIGINVITDSGFDIINWKGYGL